MSAAGTESSTVLVAVALLASIVGWAPQAGAEPIRPVGEIAVDLGMEEPVAVVHVDANDRIVVIGDDELQIISTSGTLLHRVTDLPSVTAIDVSGNLAVVAVDGRSELMVIDTTDGSIVRRIPALTTRLSSVAVVGDTIWYAHGPDQWDAGIGRASLSSDAATPFYLTGQVRAGSRIDASEEMPETVFAVLLDGTPRRLSRHELDADSRSTTLRSPYSSDAVPFAISDSGDVIWALEDDVLLEIDPGDLTRTGFVFDELEHERRGRARAALAAHGDELIALAEQGFVLTYRVGDPSLMAVADFNVRIVDVDLDDSRLFTLTGGADFGIEPAPARLIISGFDRVRPDRMASFQMEGFGEVRADRPTYTYTCDDGTTGTFEARYGWTYDIRVGPDVSFCDVDRSQFPQLRMFYFAFDADDPWLAGGGLSARQPSVESGAPAIVRTLEDYVSPLDDARLFVELQYRDILGREPDAGGVDFWTDRVMNGAMSRADYVESLVDSPEYLGSIAPVTRLYSAYFGRTPDAGGLAYWLHVFRSGALIESISSHFAQSNEFVETYGSLTDSEFIDMVYDNVLERPPDDGGRRYWLDRIADGLARGAVMTAFSESPEYVEKTNAEIIVRSIYEGLLQREPDPSGFAFWVSEYRSGRSLTGMISGFLESDEYANRFWVVDPAPVEPNADESGTWSVTTVPKVNRP